MPWGVCPVTDTTQSSKGDVENPDDLTAKYSDACCPICTSNCWAIFEHITCPSTRDDSPIVLPFRSPFHVISPYRCRIAWTWCDYRWRPRYLIHKPAILS